MATIRKTVSGLKPDSNYLFAVKPKNTEISASDTIPDSIRIKTPSSGSVPSPVNSFNIYCNFESVMFVFQPVTDQDFSEYEYEIYDGSTTSSNLVSTGRKRSTVFVVSVENSSTTVDPSTNVETVTNKKYYGRVRAINTSGNAGAWTGLVSHSGNTPLIADQYIGSLTAAKITAGVVSAEQIILKNASGPIQSYTPSSGVSVIRSSNFIEGGLGVGQGWIIKGDGTAQFDAASIRGTLSANSIFIDANNRWARNSENTAGNSEFVVGNATNQLYWNPTGGTPVGGVPTSLLKVGNSTNYIQWNNNTLTVTGAITTGANISSSTAGGIAIGSSSLYFGANQFANANTPFYVDTSSRFSLGDKLYYEVVAGTTPTLTVNGVINASGGSFSGSITATGTITGGTLNGALIQNAATSPTFKVDTSGNVFANNIYATGITTDLGLQIRADGKDSNNNAVAGASSGAIWVLSATNKETKLGNTLGSINVRYRSSSTAAPEAVVLEPAYYTGTAWSQSRHFEMNLVSGYNFYVNTDIILRGSALDGSGNDYFTDDASVVAGGEDARYVQGSYKGATRWIISRSGSSARYKENIQAVDNLFALNTIKKLKLKKFTYKKNQKLDTDESYEIKQLDYDYGFIAEEVAEQMPWLATYTATEKGKEKILNNFEHEDLDDRTIFQVENWKRYAVLSMLVGSVQYLSERVEFLESQLASK